VPHLPARTRPQRLRAGHDQELLVAGMSMTDPVADFLTRVRNGITAAHQDVEIPSSKLKREMARILKEQGYIRDFEIVAPTPEHPGELIRVVLKYTDERRSAITGLKRVSRPGQRTYVGHTEIPKVLGGMGTAIVSTSRGVMTGHEARDAGVGGEVVAHVW
jgi:small subunit ribosomal protein S8